MRPVIVGVGQVSNKDPERLAHPVDLMEEATLLAVDDARADVLAHIGSIGSTPLSVYTADDGGAMVAERLGIPAGRRERSSYSGAAPQRLLANAARAIVAGEIEAALVVGGVAEASVRNARLAGVDPPAPPTSSWSQGSGGVQVSESMAQTNAERHRGMPHGAEGAAGVRAPVDIFAFIESAIAAAAGNDPTSHRQALGELLAPFSATAASQPDLAWSPTLRTAAEISTVGPDNRFVAEPYTKLMCSFPTIDLAAAVLLTSDSLADRLGIAADRRVYPWGISCASEAGPPSVRAELDRSAALRAAVAHALETAGLDADGLARFDLYSCFPAAVQLALDAFGIAPTDPRPFTLTGGLPYFGGPGASYSLHGIVAMAEAARGDAGSVGAIVGVGGACHDFSVGLYSCAEPPSAAEFAELAEVREQLVRVAVPIVDGARATAVVDAMTVVHDRDRGPVDAPVIARLADGSRVGARAAGPALAVELSGTSLVGREVRLDVVDGVSVYEPG